MMLDQFMMSGSCEDLYNNSACSLAVFDTSIPKLDHELNSLEKASLPQTPLPRTPRGLGLRRSHNITSASLKTMASFSRNNFPTTPDIDELNFSFSTLSCGSLFTSEAVLPKFDKSEAVLPKFDNSAAELVKQIDSVIRNLDMEIEDPVTDPSQQEYASCLHNRIPGLQASHLKQALTKTMSSDEITRPRRAMSQGSPEMEPNAKKQFQPYCVDSQDSKKSKAKEHTTLARPMKRTLEHLSKIVSAPFRRKKPKMWSKDEDERLRQAVKECGTSDWKAVARVVKTRTNQMCRQRWKKKIDPRINGARKGTWTSDEDKKLKTLVKQFGCHGLKAWSAVEQGMNFTRTKKQCRERYKTHLDPSLNLGPWTSGEDKKLLQLSSTAGVTWREIMEQLPGRTQTKLKRRLDKLKRECARINTMCV